MAEFGPSGAGPVSPAGRPHAVPRNLLVLGCAQALGAAGPPVIVSLGGMVGQTLASDKALATLPVSLYQIGLAVSTVPMAMLMRRLGRRTAYLGGIGCMLLAGLVAAIGIFDGSFAVFCVGTLLAGINGACVQSYRFAAVDSVDPGQRGRAISLVLVGGLVAAVIGPQVVIWTRDLIPGVPFAGSFLGQSVLAALAIPVLLMLRAPRPQALPSVDPSTRGRAGRPLWEIARMPRFFTAVATGVVSQATMSFVMTAAPLAMVGCGHSVGEAALGIQWHVLAMFAPSFFTGRLITRFGERRVMATGLLLISIGATTALSGLAVWNFWGTLVLLGVGWNFGFIGATTAVAGCHRPEERAKVQGLNDFLVFGATALASLSSGSLLESSGWFTIQWLTFPIVVTPLLLMLLAGRGARALAKA